jgi:hypothetical protein
VQGGHHGGKTTKEKKGLWSSFVKLLAMGDFLVILVVGVVIAIVVSNLANQGIGHGLPIMISENTH